MTNGSLSGFRRNNLIWIEEKKRKFAYRYSEKHRCRNEHRSYCGPVRKGRDLD